ncbi:MAG: DUF1593 domain-containing protein [Verrucomicrobia bacterium]|nr:DUF1593 domain-containing protein [Verrucomicrobiota bacterium]MDA1068329.1 DUF1593 domain-containing protein [Verrucomicrobiota bacterium]
MNQSRLFYLFARISLLLVFTWGALSASERPRLIVLADMGHDPDEEQQITHLLMCSNEVELEGLIAVTGRFFRKNPTDSTKWLQPHLFHRLIDGYAEVYPNLKLHAAGYQDPDYLRSIVANGQTGNGMMDVGEGRWSRGVRLISEAVLRPDPRPLHVVINAGSNTLAQALYEFRASHSAEEVKAFVSKLRVFENGAQDEAGAWILHEFPDIHWVRIVNQNKAYGGMDNRKLGPHTWRPFPYSPEGQHEWASIHIQNYHGALGGLYPDRKVGETTVYIEGGGTSPWMGLVAPGLTDTSQPSWGGWSGRFSVEKLLNVPSGYGIVRPDETQYQPYRVYTDSSGISDHWVNPETGDSYDGVAVGVWRWRRAMWNDFQARMDWCVKPFDQANHHPHAVLNGDESDRILTVSAKPREQLSFDTTGSSDPDNDALRFYWWNYPEAGRKPYGKQLSLENATSSNILFVVPADASGRDIHLILEAWDQSPEVPLVDYRRIVLQVPD